MFYMLRLFRGDVYFVHQYTIPKYVDGYATETLS